MRPFFRKSEKDRTIEFVFRNYYNTIYRKVKDFFMRDYDETEIEYLEENSDYNEDIKYNRRNVDNIKKLIVCGFITLCAVPVFFCLYLMVKLNKLDAKAGDLESQINVQNQISQSMIQTEATELTDMISNQDALLLDQSASASLDKEPGESTQVLMGSSEDIEGDVEDISISVDGNTQDFTDNSSNVSGSITPTTESESVSVKSKYKVYLTFDDGPSIHTDEILDVLKANDVKATFFVVYTPDEKLWPMYKRIVDEGHTLAMHSYTHVYDEIYASEDSFVNDVTAIHDFLYEQTGYDCKYYRFPGGSSNSVSSVDIQDLMGYLYEDGITYYDWNSLSEDAMDHSLTPDELNENVMSSVRVNTCDSIVLLHDLRDNPNTAEGLQDLIDTLKEEGYQICPIDDNTIPVQHITYEAE